MRIGRLGVAAMAMVALGGNAPSGGFNRSLGEKASPAMKSRRQEKRERAAAKKKAAADRKRQRRAAQRKRDHG